MHNTLDIPTDVRQAAAQIAEVRPMRRGSLSERYVKCSKPGCLCAGRSDSRHGPYYSLTRAVGGQTQSRFLSAGQADIAVSQVEAGRRFREQVAALWEACERWADAQLETAGATSQEEAQKGGSKRRSKPRLRKRSKRS